jgi:hypothetical protein
MNKRFSLFIVGVFLFTACERHDSSLSPALIKAVTGADANAVTSLLGKKADPNASDEKKQSVLMTAATLGNLEIAKALVDAGADLNAQNEGGITALMSASLMGKTQIVKLLLERRANTELRNNDQLTALLMAAISGEAEIVELLLEGGAKVNDRRPSDGVTPLHAAAGRGHGNVIKALLRKGADLEDKTKDGKTAKQLAEANGQIHVTAFLERLSKLGLETILKPPKKGTDDLIMGNADLFSKEKVQSWSDENRRGTLTWLPESNHPMIQSVIDKYGEPENIEKKEMTLKYTADFKPLPEEYAIHWYGRIGLAAPIKDNPDLKVTYIFFK